MNKQELLRALKPKSVATVSILSLTSRHRWRKAEEVSWRRDIQRASMS